MLTSETEQVDDYWTPRRGLRVFEGLHGPGAAHRAAFAKYYGGYGAIEEGYVHHALHDLTGSESEA